VIESACTSVARRSPKAPKTIRGGTGLGLAVVRTIADEHHATIDVISEPGGGAEFVVSFPHREEVARA
jgi:signal transduction histidine kinase